MHRRPQAPHNVEPDAAWQKLSEQSDRDYLPIKLDDPSFPTPIYVSLSKAEDGDEDGHRLVWPAKQELRFALAPATWRCPFLVVVKPETGIEPASGLLVPYGEEVVCSDRAIVP